MARDSRASFCQLRHLIGRSLENRAGFGSRVQVEGKINRIADGLWHDNYWFQIRERDLPAARAERAFILRLLEQRYDWQSGPEPLERLLREAQTLQALDSIDFAHPTPEFICFVHHDDSEPIGMLETALPGISFDDFRGRTTLRRIARVAATVHRTAIDKFPHFPRSADRAEQAKTSLNEIDRALFDEFPLADAVRGWIEAHLPSGGRVCLLHGDLLPQNLLRDWPDVTCEDPPVGIIDWEMARVDDPAYDLAIVSRGNRKVLGVTEGLKILVEDYLNAGGEPISLTDVRVYELLLVLHWLDEVWREHQRPGAGGHGPDYYVDQLRSLFQRVEA
jgi:aminoglycoside phosphotransferase (APT) family kinase protein